MSVLEVDIQGINLVHLRYEGLEINDVPYKSIRVKGSIDLSVVFWLYKKHHNIEIPKDVSMTFSYGSRLREAEEKERLRRRALERRDKSASVWEFLRHRFIYLHQR